MWTCPCNTRVFLKLQQSTDFGVKCILYKSACFLTFHFSWILAIFPSSVTLILQYFKKIFFNHLNPKNLMLFVIPVIFISFFHLCTLTFIYTWTSNTKRLLAHWSCSRRMNQSKRTLMPPIWITFRVFSSTLEPF